MIKAYAVQMSFPISDSEKRIAEKASESFNDLNAKLKLAINHLNILYMPFKKYQDYDSQELLNYRRVLRRYRDKVKDNFDDIMQRAYKSTVLMGEFAMDKQTTDLMNSFIAHISDIRKQVNRFLGLFSNIGSAEFISSILKAIEFIKKDISQLRQLVTDRVLEHIDTNILAKKWISNVTDEHQNKVYEKLPLMVQLFKERQKAIYGE